MADLSITTDDVALSDAQVDFDLLPLGATMDPGDAYYVDSNNVMQLADASAAATAGMQGVLVTGGAEGDWAFGVKLGPIVIGATLVQGAAYVVSATAGGICPQADLGEGDVICHAGYAVSTSVFYVKPVNTGVETPAP